MTTTQNRKFQPLRFAVGLLLCASGISIILLIATRVVTAHSAGQYLAPFLFAAGVLTGVILLGGGFAMMVVASPGFEADGPAMVTQESMLTSSFGPRDAGTESDGTEQHVEAEVRKHSGR